MKRLYFGFAAALGLIAVALTVVFFSFEDAPHEDLSNEKVQSVTVAEDSLTNAAAFRKKIATADDLATPAATKPVELRITQLPEDGGKWHLSVITNNPANYSQRDVDILNAFDTNPDLQWLKQQTQFHHYFPGSRMWSSYAHCAPSKPCVFLQNSAGRKVYMAWDGGSLPSDDAALAADLQQMINQYDGESQTVERHCPVCPKTPDQPAPAKPTVTLAAVTEKVPTSGTGGNDDFVVAGCSLVMFLVVGVVIGVWRKSRS